MNSLNLVGRLTRDPELRTTPSGKSVCDMRIAVDGAGEDAKPLYLDIATFGPQAEACARYLSKGRQIAFSGRLVYQEWETAEGAKRSRHSGIGHVEFLGRGEGAGSDSEPGEPADEPERPAASRRRREPVAVSAGDDDIPF